MRGSIIKDGPNNYRVAYSTIDPTTGKRRQHTKRGFRTKGGAREFLNSIIGKVQDGTYQPDTKVTVRELLTNHWLPWQRLQRDLRPSTVAFYEKVIQRWLVPELGDRRAASLRPSDVTSLIESLRTGGDGRRPLSARSAQMAVGVLKAATRYGHYHELLSRDPLAQVKRPSSQSPTMRVWDEAQVRNFLQATKGTPLNVAWSLALCCGLRRGELLGLRWENVDLDDGRLRILETIVPVDGVPVPSVPKTDRGKRTVPLDALLVAVLRAQRAVQATYRLKAGEAYDHRGFIVADELGRPGHPDNLTKDFRRAASTSGLPPIRLHDCRHTAATHMLRRGTPVNVVAAILGVDPAVLVRTYAHEIEGQTTEAVTGQAVAFLG